MKELKTKKVDLFVSNGSFQGLQKRFKGGLDANKDIASYLSDKVDDLYREEKKFKEYIEIYSEIFGLNGFALLEAESDDLKTSLDEGYRDGKRVKSVQGWVNRHDGKYACLFIGVHGISEEGLKSVKSLLFIPDYGVSDRVFYLHSPIYGIINGYFIESSLKELKELKGLKGLTIEEARKNIVEKGFKKWLEACDGLL